MGHGPTRKSAQEVFYISRVGLVQEVSNLTGRVGSGHPDHDRRRPERGEPAREGPWVYRVVDHSEGRRHCSRQPEYTPRPSLILPSRSNVAVEIDI